MAILQVCNMAILQVYSMAILQVYRRAMLDMISQSKHSDAEGRHFGVHGFKYTGGLYFKYTGRLYFKYTGWLYLGGSSIQDGYTWEVQVYRMAILGGL